MIVLAYMAWSTAALAQSQDLNTSIVADNQEDTYQRCLIAAQMAPETGMDMALRWRKLNGGEPSQHCLAIAMIEIGDSEAAAPLLDSLAQSSTATAPVRAGLHRQAAQAWMENADYGNALAALEEAAVLVREDATLFLDLAVAHAALDDYWAAVDDLNKALDIDAAHTEALVLRGSAYRLLGFPELAVDDLERALVIDPNNLDTLLELGLLARDADNKIEARQHWLRVLERAPTSSTADAVRQHLEVMDVQTSP